MEKILKNEKTKKEKTEIKEGMWGMKIGHWNIKRRHDSTKET